MENALRDEIESLTYYIVIGVKHGSALNSINIVGLALDS